MIRIFVLYVTLLMVPYLALAQSAEYRVTFTGTSRILLVRRIYLGKQFGNVVALRAPVLKRLQKQAIQE